MSLADYRTLIEPADLARLIGAAPPRPPSTAAPAAPDVAPDIARDIARDIVIVDCRHDLGRPQWGAQAYATAHVPGAVFAHLDRDLSAPVTPETGRHPLPERARFATTLGRWGIDHRVQVIAYDQANAAFAARLWWMLRWMGHERVAVLDGGFAAWQSAGLPVTDVPGAPAPRHFDVRPPLAAAVSTTQVAQALGTGRLLLIDARAADRFAGRNESLDPLAGHVPGARNHPFTRNLAPDGRFLEAGELRRRWSETLGAAAADQVAAMCGSGITACHNLLALQVAGFHGARLYAGSWSEWIRDPQRPRQSET